jgi:hypothetical protein
MTIFHPQKKNNSLDFSMAPPNIIVKQTVGIAKQGLLKFIPITRDTRNRGVIDMRAHSQTIDQRHQVGVRVSVGELDWFQRLYQWFKSFSYGAPQIEPVSPYGTWDAKREKFQPMKAEAAVDIVAARNGFGWTERIYGASV